MKTALVAVLLLGLMVAVPPAGADDFLADFQGFDWLWPDGECLNCPGQHYEAQGFVGSVNPTYLICDFVHNEYTFYLGNSLVFSSAEVYGTTVIAHYSGGTINFMEDSKTTGTPGVYNSGGYCDPLVDHPLFVDGNVILSGYFTSFDIIYDTALQNGSLVGVTNWNGGSQLGNLPVGQRTGWTFGAIGLPQTVPCGYHWQIDGNCVLQEPVPVRSSTWGEIKSSVFPTGRIGIRR
jgi:hypothetical protein